MTFLAPALLFGLALASAPIIIHLLNRRRFLRVDWGPMKYLKLTLKSNRRRLRLEQWLLLAVRTLAIVMLFLAIARPMSSGANLAGFLKVQGRASRVIVIDDSLSMSFQTNGRSAFEQAKQAASSIVQAVGAQDSLTVVTSSQPSQPLVRHAQLEEADLTRLESTISELEGSDRASAWAATFDAVDRHLETAVFPLKEVIVITDLWANGWTSDLTELCDRWSEQDVTLRIVDVGDEPEANRRVLSFEQSDPVALVDTEVHFIAEIQNDGAEPLSAGQAMLTVDEEVQALTLPDLPTGETVEVPISLTFDTPGLHRVSLSIPHDGLSNDDDAHLIVDVRRLVEVTLVDGEPGLGAFESELDFLAIALTAGNAPWQMNTVLASEWATQPIGAPDVIVLGNVERLEPDRVRQLEQLVSAGTGLMIFGGEQLDIEAYNETLFKGGEGLLPVRLSEIKDADTTGLVIEPHAVSPLSPLLKLSAESLGRVRPRRFISTSVDEEPGADVRVLARWNNPASSPAVIEKRFGDGRVMFWTMTADRDWSDWPTEASFVLAMRMAADSVAARILRWENVTTGQPLRFPLDPEFAPQTAKLSVPPTGDEVSLSIERAEGTDPMLLSAATRRAGHYTALWEAAGIGEKTHPFAASPDVTDSRLERIDTAGLEPFLGRLTPQLIRFSGESIDVATAGTELWRSAVLALVSLIVVESLLAPWVGRVR
ncbi:MAG: BatA domain-containing protein [Planctomycetaceae bacterium]|nr:BatA domain-containing protein [Planctomycetaceae bacterium]